MTDKIFYLSEDFILNGGELSILEDLISRKTERPLNIVKALQSFLWVRRLNYSILEEERYLNKYFEIFEKAKKYISEVAITAKKIHSTKGKKISLSKLDCLRLLSSMFFCCSKRVHTFLHRDEKAKFKCMITYFEYMFGEDESKLQNEYLIIGINKLDNNLKTKDLDVKLSDIKIDEESKIEDLDDKNLKIDFANEYIGGGVLNFGCVQEEILFSIYPELLVSMFVCRKMNPDEAIFIKGARRIAEYSGYAWTFTYLKPYEKPQNPELNVYVGIDALNFGKNSDPNIQFNRRYIEREICKAYAGFMRNEEYDDLVLRDVVTGRWGCGEFGGYFPLKFLIMWIAASMASRRMIICTLRDESTYQIRDIVERFKNLTALKLFQKIIDLRGIRNFERNIIDGNITLRQSINELKKVDPLSDLHSHDEPDKPGKVNESDKPGKVNEPDKPGKVNETDKPGKINEFEETKRSNIKPKKSKKRGCWN